MAVRHYTEIETVRLDRFRIEIDDTEWVAASTELFSGAADGFTLSYPVALEKFPGMLPSEFKYSVAIANNGDGNFINDIATSDTERFRLNCYKWDGADWVFWWGGVLSPNIAKYQDLYYPYVFDIVATDGLAFLRNVDYNDDGEAYIDESRLIDIVAKILKKLPYVVDVWTGSTDFIRTIIDYYESGHTYAAANCPLYYTSVNERAFWELGSKGVKKWMKCDKVLNNILKMFNCQMYQTQGVWLIQQLDIRRDVSFYSRQYDYAISAPTAAPDMYGVVNIDPGDDHPRLTGGHYDWLNALKRVKIKYNAQERRNFTDFTEFSNSTVAFEYGFYNVDYESGSASLRVKGTIVASIKNISYTAGNFFCPKWGLRIKVGSYYLKRTLTYANGQISASPAEWTLSASQYEITPGVVQAPAINDFYNVNTPFDFQTPILVASGELRVQIGHDISLNTNFETYWSLNNLFIEVSATDGNDVEYQMVQPDGTGVEEYEIETLFADGISNNSAGRLIVGGTGSTLWGLGGDTPDKPLVDLLMEQLLKSLDKPKRRMRGAVFGPEYPVYHILDDGSDEWVFIGGRYTAADNNWQGEWVKLDPGSATYDPPIIIIGDDYPPTDAPGDSNPGGLGASGLENLAPSTLEPVSAAKTASLLSAGAITSIPVSAAISARGFVDGQVLSIVNLATGQSDALTVTADSDDGDTAIAVTGTLTVDYGAGSYIMVRLDNYTLQSGLPPFNLPEGTTGDHLYFDGTNWVARNFNEDAQDGVGGILVDTQTINFTYTDATPSITAAAITQMSITADAGGLMLSGDSATPGNTKLYGTNGSGVKGWYAQPSGGALSDGDYGDITVSGTGTVMNIDAGVVGTTELADLNVTTGKIADLAVTTGKMADDAITFAKIQNINEQKLLGRDSPGAGLGNIQEIGLAASLAFDTGGNIQRAALTGDVTAAINSNTTTIANDAVTNAKAANMPANTIKGNNTAGAADPLDLTVTQAQTLLGFLNSTANLVSPRIPFANDANTLQDEVNLRWLTGTQEVIIGGDTSLDARFSHNSTANITGNSTLLAGDNNVSGDYMILLKNTRNVSNTGRSIIISEVGGTSAGDAYYIARINGGDSWCFGLDNSDADKWKLTPKSTAPGGVANSGVIVTSEAAAKVGINLDAPARALDVAGTTRAINLVNTQAIPTVGSLGNGLGTGPTIDLVDGGNNGFIIQFTTGTAPTANGDLFRVTYANAFTTYSFPVWSADNNNAATDYNKFYRSNMSPAWFEWRANGTLAASTSYQFIFVVMGL